MNPSAEESPVVSYIEERLGLSFAGPRRERMLRVLESARAEAGAGSYRVLREALDSGAALAEVVGGLTVGESYFFRERPQMDLLRHEALPDAAGRAAGPLQLWSAGCAAGEEAYTLAALAQDCGLLERCRITGTDLSAHAIARARRALYGRWALRATTDAERSRCFRRTAGGFLVDDRLRARVRFLQANLLDGPPPPGRFDVVLCRNLLLYLTPAAVVRAAGVLRDALSPDGWLLTASGDPPLDAPGLHRVRTPHGLVYRRSSTTGGGKTSSSHRHPRPPRVPMEETREPVRHHVAAPGAAAGRGQLPTTVESTETAQRIRALADAGRLQEAAAMAADGVQSHPLDAELRYLSAVVALESGRLDDAATAAAAAVYLDPDLAAAHVLLGQAEHARGSRPRARRSFRNAVRLLEATPADAPVDLTPGVPVAHLAAVAARYLRDAEGAL